MQGIETLIVVSIVMFVVLGAISVLAHIYNLNNIKAKTVGDGQHGTARWARKGEIEKTYRHIQFTPELWRKGKNLPKGFFGVFNVFIHFCSFLIAVRSLDRRVHRDTNSR